MKFLISVLGALLVACNLTAAAPNASTLTIRDFVPRPDDPSNGPTHLKDLAQDMTKQCGDRTYTSDDIYKAASWAMKLREKDISRGRKTREFPEGRYPHEYKNYDKKFDFGPNCPDGEDRQENPLIKNGPYNGGPANQNWGPDRVVFYHKPGELAVDEHPLGYYCETITHTGAAKGQFVACK